MKLILIIWGLFFLYRVLSNGLGILRVRYYKRKYEEFLAKPNDSFFIHEESVKRIFNQAQISDVWIPDCQPVGFGMIQTRNARVFSNMGVTRLDVVCAMRQCFLKAEGAFHANLVESFSPLYWVRSLIFLPSKMCEYLGGKSDQLVVKIFQLIYWVLTPLILIWRDNLYQIVRQLMDQLP